MKRLIICEGQTEQAFCNDVLQDYFNAKGIIIENPTIKKSRGGIVAWNELKKQIETHLKQDSAAYVSLFIDYYGIKEKHLFPNWKKSFDIVVKDHRLSFLEKEMYNNIDENLNYRFIPYLQLHEFESLLFCNKEVFDNSFEKDEFLDYNYFLETLQSFPNPEDINDGDTTAPSKRLERIIKGYKSQKDNFKVLYGSTIAHDIGLKKIMSKCPRFNAWIMKLENIK